MSDEPDDEFDLAAFFGSSTPSSFQILTLYIPELDRHGRRIPRREDWVRQASELLARIGGGVTVLPPVDGGWFDEEAGEILWEKTVLAYTYIKPEAFTAHLEELRSFLHRLGRDTKQGEVVFEFDGQFYRITDYAVPEEEEGL